MTSSLLDLLLGAKLVAVSALPLPAVRCSRRHYINVRTGCGVPASGVPSSETYGAPTHQVSLSPLPQTLGRENTYVALSAYHLLAVKLGCQSLERGFDEATTQTQNQMERRLLPQG